VTRLSLTPSDVGYDCSITIKGLNIFGWPFVTQALAYKSVFNFTYRNVWFVCLGWWSKRSCQRNSRPCSGARHYRRSSGETDVSTRGTFR